MTRIYMEKLCETMAKKNISCHLRCSIKKKKKVNSSKHVLSNENYPISSLINKISDLITENCTKVRLG